MTYYRMTTLEGGPARAALVGCFIIKFPAANGAHGDDYMFFGPNNSNRSNVLHQVNVPFVFPMFNARLSGDIDRNWFIQVNYVDNQEMRGIWGNVSVDDQGRVSKDSDADPDIWVAQANQGEEFGDYEEKVKEAVASASSKL